MKKYMVLGGSWRPVFGLFLVYFHILKALAPPYYILGRPGPAPAYYKSFPVTLKGHPGWFKMMNEARHVKIRVLHRMGPHVSVRNINRSKLYVSSPPTWFYGGVGVRRQANVEIIPKKYAKKIKGCPYILSLNRTTTTVVLLLLLGVSL